MIMNIVIQDGLFADNLPNPHDRQTLDKSARAQSGTFADTKKLPVHRWFRYSAGFSARWVEELINDQSRHQKPVVLDPFVGSGTSLVACEKNAVSSYGYESHPFICRVAKAKLLWRLNETDFVKRALAFLAQVQREMSSIDRTSSDLLARCFMPEPLEQLLTLRDCYTNAANDSEEWELIWLAITAILRPCSHVGTAQWQYVLPSRQKARVLDPFTAFRTAVIDMAADMAQAKRLGFESTATVIQHDARIPSSLAPDSIDLVVTSPPYPNNYDYADATRLEMTFWREIAGWSDLQAAVRKYIVRSCSQHAAADRLDIDNLLAAPSLSPIRSELSEACHSLAIIRLERGGRKTYHTMAAAYFGDLAQVFRSLRSICRTPSRLCFVVGDSAPYGVHLPVEKWLGQLALASGFRSFHFEKIRDRNIKWKNRKHRVPLHEGRLWIEG